GTTDIFIEDPDEAVCTDDEVDYFLEFAKIVFPNIDIKREEIVYAFSGVRPLPTSDANSAGQVSRDHHNEIIEPGDLYNYPIFNLVGGKWTSFRAFSEQVADVTLDRLGENRVESTTNRPIGGGANYPATDEAQEAWIQELAQETETSADRIGTLFDRYGTGARAIALFCADGDDRPLQHEPSYSEREVIWLTRTEKVVHINDLLQRRSLLALTGRVSNDLMSELAAIIGQELGWAKERQQEEADKAAAELKAKHRVML
ncbi:MAG: glycerol-3-phosphate dehydrogenase C-terminal domain-containing protein, partial [Chloroflexota bacterium]